MTLKTIIGFGQNLLTYETAFLLGLAHSLPEYSIAVNIGAGEGISAAAILEGANHLHHFKLISVDLEPCENEPALLDSLNLNDPDRYMQVVMDSKDFAEQWDGEEPHLVFVDGSHTYKQVLWDMNAWSTSLIEGGLLIAHDYQDSRQKEVTQAVQEWRKKRGKSWQRLGQVLHMIAFQKPGSEDWSLGRNL